jgi:hypothetical protein
MGVVPIARTPWTTFGLDFHGGACASCLQPLQRRFSLLATGNAHIPYTIDLSAHQAVESGCVARAAIQY